ncbi:RFX DNA-binding domain-domain-containing protein [Syncephalastrum racemosum]|uniref:RFX DNA-binding domain-domain-containing protein n=1 Tax=Syncephalastrum racemosum TaxID=13706 RepID=A0A1X2H2K5_SYNRA|nr:RFX DNA-binding domain-domain-containing protein [Syncephalastrum racemosum]
MAAHRRKTKDNYARQRDTLLEWLKNNYEPAPKESTVLRSDVNEHYRNEFPFQPGDEPIHSAVLGKLLKNVCPDVVGRRLGTRGDSRYYYSGIRRRGQGVPLQFVFENSNYQPNTDTDNNNNNNNDTSIDANINIDISPASDQAVIVQPSRSLQPQPELQLPLEPPLETNPMDVKRLPVFVTPAPLPTLAASFAASYENHCLRILTNVTSPETIQTMDRDFYELLDMEFRELINENDEIWEAVWRWDACLYDTIISTYIPSLDAPVSREMEQRLLTLVDKMESYIPQHMFGYPAQLLHLKLDVAMLFGAKLERLLRLNRLAQNAKGHMQFVSKSWDQLPVTHIMDEIASLTRISPAILTLRFDAVEHLIQTKASLSDWTMWVDKTLDTCLEDTPKDGEHLRQAMMRWTLCTSLVQRHATAEGIPSQVPVAALCQFLDEYFMYTAQEKGLRWVCERRKAAGKQGSFMSEDTDTRFSSTAGTPSLASTN